MVKVNEAMMNLIASEVFGQKLLPELFQTLSQEESIYLFRLAKIHDLAHLVGNALIKNNLLQDDNLKNAYNKELCASVFRYEQLAFEFGAIKNAFDDAKIENIPLKGAVTRSFYPQPWMRTSCDIDILVHEEDLDRAVNILKERLNYVCEREEKRYHDVQMFSPSGVHIELHYSLIEEDVMPSINQIMSCAWDYAVKVENSYQQSLLDQMFYFYHIAHMVKHFIEGGCGVKPFLDLWILNNNKNISFDRDKRESLLSNGLIKFEREAVYLAEVWFGENEHTQTSRKMEKFVLEGGVYGNRQNRVALQQVKKGGKFKYILSRIWVPFDRLKIQYPTLQRRKWLYPFYQIRRWFNLLFNGKAKQSAKELSMNKNTTAQEQNEMNLMLKELGLK